MAEETHLCIGESLVDLKGPDRAAEWTIGQWTKGSTNNSTQSVSLPFNCWPVRQYKFIIDFFAFITVCNSPNLHNSNSLLSPNSSTTANNNLHSLLQVIMYAVGQWRTLFMRYHHLRASVGFQLSSSGWIRDWWFERRFPDHLDDSAGDGH